MSKSVDNTDNNSINGLNNSTHITPLKNKTTNEHNRRIFSVDDDPEEVKHDIRYLEGLHDGLKYALKSKKSVGLHPFKSAPVVDDITDKSNNNKSNIIVSKNKPKPSDNIENHIDSELDNVASNKNRSLPGLLTANSTSVIPTEASLKRPRPVEHRSLSKIALLTTPESGIGFDFNSNNKNNLLDNNNNFKNDLILNLSPSDSIHTPLVSKQDINNDIVSLHDNESENYVIHDSSINNDVMIEQIPLTHNKTNHNLNAPIINKNVLDLENNNLDMEDCVSTTSSLESFTLRERQDAINKTHPFGIRIWKPALYKKKRSVQKAAVDDIHETKFKKISWFVHLGNLIWTLTIGLFFSIIFTLSGIMVCVFGGFTQSARDYSLVFFRLAKYLFWPFGKVVYLLQDEHYLEEDRDEGISTQQFYKWVTSYSNKLFFHQSQSFSVNNNDSHQRGASHFPSYGSINGFVQPTHGNNNIAHSKNDNNTTTNRFDNMALGMTRNSSNTPSMSGINNGPLADESLRLMNDFDNSQRRFFGRGQWSLGRILFYMLFHLFLEPTVLLISLMTWLFVFTIPMSNILWNLLHHCRKHPLALGFKNISNTSSPETNSMNMHADRNVLLCTFRCAGWHYYKFTMDGTNVIVMNLIFLVFFTIFDYFILKSYFNLDYWFTDEQVIFIMCLASIVPLAFYIGQAVASISAQTSMGVGAVVNAFFSTIVEIFLYCVALEKREGPLVEGSLIGSILGAVLLLPGLSMCGGALNRKTQRYNPASAGVSSALLIFSMIVLFVPTVLNEIYGVYTVKCDEDNDSYEILSLTVTSAFHAMTQSKCYFVHPPLTYDKFYSKVIQPMSICSAVVLFIAYVIGLWFTLRTHAKMIWELPIQNNERITNGVEATADIAATNKHESPNDTGHEAPNWSRAKSTWVLLIATLLYAIIAEILVDCVSSVLEAYPSVSPKILGLTIFALVPNTTEFLNAISFAIHGNVALSMEIGTAYALQVCQLQIPALVIFSVVYTWNMPNVNISEQMFTLVLPKWDIIGFIASIFMFTYLYAEGKSNYFKGSILILMYIVIILGFYFQSLLVDL